MKHTTRLRWISAVLLFGSLTHAQKVTAPSGLPVPDGLENKAEGLTGPAAPRRKIVLVRGKKNAAAAADDPATVEALRKAGEFVASERFEEAATALTAIVERQPSSAAAWRERGRLHVRLGNWDDAIADLGKSLELNPQQAETWLLRCAAGMESTSPREAGRDCLRAAELNPADAPAIEALAAAYASVREFVRTAEAFESSIERKADFPDAYVKTKGAVSTALSRCSTALAKLQRMLSEYTGAVYPDKPGLLDRVGQFSEAVRTYQSVIAKSRTSPARTRMLISRMGRHEQAWLLSEGGRAAQEIASAMPSLKTVKSRETVLRATAKPAAEEVGASSLPAADVAELRAGGADAGASARGPGAATEMRESIEVAAANPPPAPSTAGAKAPVVLEMAAIAAAAIPTEDGAGVLSAEDQLRTNLEEASLFVKARQDDKAILAYSRALEIRQDLPVTWRDRARLRAKLGDIPGAISDFTASLRHNPEQPGLWAELCGLRLKDADPRLASADCAKAVQAAPSSSEAHFALARAHSVSRKFVDAAEHLQSAIERQPEFPEAHLELSRTYLELEEYVLALHHATMAIQQRPGFGDAYRLRASAKEVLGDKIGCSDDIARAAAR